MIFILPIELLVSDDKILNSVQDICNYFDEIFACLRKNEDIYKMLLVSNGSLIFLEHLKKLAGEKIYHTLQNIIKNNPYLELDVNFYMDGVISELVKYFRGQSDYSLDQLLVNSKKWFEKIFN